MARSDTTTRSGKGGSGGGGGGGSGGKKVTTACDTCRLKRQKCDAARPECGACTENKLVCAYSRQTRRRGPPLGYLRHVEVRLHIADAFLGFVIACEPTMLSTLEKYADTMAASNVVSSSQAGTEADSTIQKWDTWNAKWRESPVSRLLDSLSARFATPVSRPEVESPLRSGPPSAGTNSGLPRTSTSLISSNPTSSARHRIEQEGHKSEVPYKALHLSVQDDYSVSPDTLVSSGSRLPWSQELAMADPINNAQSAAPSLQPLPASPSNGANLPLVPRNDTISFDLASLLGQSTWLPISTESKGNQTRGSGRHRMSNTGDADATGLDTVRYQGSATGMHHQALDASYSGSFWRLQTSYTLDVAQPKDIDIRTTSASQLSSSTSTPDALIEFPPVQVQHHLAEVYLQNVHPLFPLLSRTAILNRNPKSRNLVLALCAYCACISSTSGMEDSAAFASGVGDSTRIAADMWYEQARSSVMNQSLRRPNDLETIQTVLFLVLRDQGRGMQSQAWLLMGIVVRMSEDLGLHLDSSTWGDVPDHVKDMRRRVWGVVCIVDLLISLQLGRPSSILDHQWASEIPISPPPPPDAGHPGSLETYSTPTPHYFAYTASLCLIISRINSQLYLCGNTMEAEKLEKLHSLRGELDAWHARLPSALRISTDHTAPLPVLDVNLLYHSALILLYRPLRSNPNIPAIRTSLDAASAFNVLLSSYRTAQRYERSNPHLIYLIFTAGITHLSGIHSAWDSLLSSASPPSSTMLVSQSNLLSCVEALKDISSSWPLAEWCHRIMTGLMKRLGGIQKERLEDNNAPRPPFGPGISPAQLMQYPAQSGGGGSGSRHCDDHTLFSLHQYPQSYSRSSPAVLSSPVAQSTSSSSRVDRRRQHSHVNLDTMHSTNHKRLKFSHFHYSAQLHSQHRETSRHHRSQDSSVSPMRLVTPPASFESSSTSRYAASSSRQYQYPLPKLPALDTSNNTLSTAPAPASAMTTSTYAPNSHTSRTTSASNSNSGSSFRATTGNGEAYLPFDLFTGTGWAGLNYTGLPPPHASCPPNHPMRN